MSTAAATHRLDFPGASIYYEVRGSGPLLACSLEHRWAALVSQRWPT